MLTKNVWKYAVVVLLLFAAESAWAQGEFLSGDETGVGLASGVIFGPDTAYGFSAGWAFDPNLDLNVSYAVEAGGDHAVTSTSLTLFGKSGYERNNVGMAFSAGFFRGDRASESGFLLGGGLFGNIALSDELLLQPSVFAASLLLDEDRDDQTSVEFGSALVYGHQTNFRPFLKLGYVAYSNDDLNGAAVQIGFVKTH